LGRGLASDVPTVAGARAIQERLRGRVLDVDRFGPVRRVAGADVSFDRFSPVLFAAVVVIDVATGALVERAGARSVARFPYVPGYLSFRELPPLLEAFAKLETRPDLVIADGHGRAHPRRVETAPGRRARQRRGGRTRRGGHDGRTRPTQRGRGRGPARERRRGGRRLRRRGRRPRPRHARSTSRSRARPDRRGRRSRCPRPRSP